MATRHNVVQVPIGSTYTMISDGAITGAFTFQVRGPEIEINCNSTAEPPTGPGLIYENKMGHTDNALTAIFPGLPGATHFFARSNYAGGVFISHA